MPDGVEPGSIALFTEKAMSATHGSARSGGFTLIEIMVAVAILGILAGIAMPTYRNYIARSEAGSALATIDPLKANVEEEMVSDATTDLTLLENIGTVSNANALGVISSTVSGLTGSGELIFTFSTSSPLTLNRTLRLVRDGSTGTWSCVSDLEPQHRPLGCSEL
jgi:type IV pilus assembly protein PilA